MYICRLLSFVRQHCWLFEIYTVEENNTCPLCVLLALTCVVPTCCTCVYGLMSWTTQHGSQYTHTTWCLCPSVPTMCMDVHAHPHKTPPPRSPPRPFASNKVSIIGVECTSSLWSCHDMQKLSPHELHTGTLPIIILNVEVFQCCVVVMIQCYNITSHECIKIRLSVHGRSIFPILFPRESQ